MHVKIDRRPEPLDPGDGASASAPDAAARGSTALEAEESANEDPEDSSAELVIPRSRVAESMRQRQDPLPHGQAPEHVVGQMAGELRHAPPAARGTEAPPFTRKSNQDLVPALVAAKSREAAREHAAREKLAQLPLDEGGQPLAAAAGSPLLEEALEVLA